MKTLSSLIRPLLALLASTILVGSGALARSETSVTVGAAGATGAVTVTPAAIAASSDGQTPLTREILILSLNRALSTHFNFEGELQVELLRAWTPPAKIAAVWELNVIDFPTVATSSMMVRCQVLADAVLVAETTFVLRAQLWRDGWATRQPVTAGSAFDASLLEARRVDLLRDRDVLPAAVGDRSYVFTRAVGAGRMLTWRDIGRRPLVKKGDVVEVSAVDGPLVVTMKGLAMENGAQGETVTVRNPDSRKTFAALVVDENRVQIRF